MGSVVNKIYREVKVTKTFRVIRTLIEGCRTFRSVDVGNGKKKTIDIKAEKITYRTVQQMFGEEQRPLMYLPYDKKKFDLLTHAIIKLDDFVFEIMPENVCGELGYEVKMMTKEFRLLKTLKYTINGDLADCTNYTVEGLPALSVREYVLTIHDLLFKENIDYDNGTAVIGIVNK